MDKVARCLSNYGIEFIVQIQPVQMKTFSHITLFCFVLFSFVFFLWGGMVIIYRVLQGDTFLGYLNIF